MGMVVKSTSNIALPINQVCNVISTMAIRLIIKPVLIMSRMRRRPDANTIAFGGVATGIMNAIDADNVTGSINNRGLISICFATEATTGSSI